jgi:hypothetical protein
MKVYIKTQAEIRIIKQIYPNYTPQSASTVESSHFQTIHTNQTTSIKNSLHQSTMSASGYPATVGNQDHRRSLKGALQWWAEKVTGPNQNEHSRQGSHDGQTPSPYNSTAFYQGKQGKGF